MDESMYGYILNKTQGLADRPSFSFNGQKLMLSEVKAAVDSLAAYLQNRLGVKKGDVVSINLPNVPHIIIAFYAINKCGAVANIIHPLMPAKALIGLITKSNSKYLFTLDVFLKDKLHDLLSAGITPIVCRIGQYLSPIKRVLYGVKVRSKLKDLDVSRCIEYAACFTGTAFTAPDIAATDPAAYLHSGGTSGVPKTIVLPNCALNNLAEKLRDVIGEEVNKTNAMLMVLPLFHGFGLGVCMHSCFSYGFKIVMLPQFDAKGVCKLINKEKITMISGVPSMYEKLMKEPSFYSEQLRDMRYLFCGGDKLPYPLKEAFDAKLAQHNCPARLQEGYGLTEVVTVCTVNRKEDNLRDSVGFPLTGISAKIIDESGNRLPVGAKGEICVSGNTVMTGYLDDKESTENTLRVDEDGQLWVHTSDYGYMDEEGRVFFLDRIKRMVKISSINVFPAEIENVAQSVTGIAKSCAFDLLDEHGKPYIALYVVTKAGVAFDKALEENLQRALTENLMKYSLPRRIEAVESLPLTLVGKVDYKKMKAQVLAQENK